VVLRLRFRRRIDEVAAAVFAVADRLPESYPVPRVEGRRLYVPGHPTTVDMLVEELEKRGLKTLAERVCDPVRWR
jgi:hypothetical protein